MSKEYVPINGGESIGFATVELDSYIRSDQPSQCPRDGRRTELVGYTGGPGSQSIERCPECGMTFFFEDDDPEECDDDEDDENTITCANCGKEVRDEDSGTDSNGVSVCWTCFVKLPELGGRL